MFGGFQHYRVPFQMQGNLPARSNIFQPRGGKGVQKALEYSVKHGECVSYPSSFPSEAQLFSSWAG